MSLFTAGMTTGVDALLITVSLSATGANESAWPTLIIVAK